MNSWETFPEATTADSTTPLLLLLVGHYVERTLRELDRWQLVLFIGEPCNLFIAAAGLLPYVFIIHVHDTR